MTQTKCDICGKIIEENSEVLCGGVCNFKFEYRDKSDKNNKRELRYEVCQDCSDKMDDYKRNLITRCAELITGKFPKFIFDKTSLEMV